VNLSQYGHAHLVVDRLADGDGRVGLGVGAGDAAQLLQLLDELRRQRGPSLRR
jgi:hypothetical protein